MFLFWLSLPSVRFPLAGFISHRWWVMAYILGRSTIFNVTNRLKTTATLLRVGASRKPITTTQCGPTKWISSLKSIKIQISELYFLQTATHQSWVSWPQSFHILSRQVMSTVKSDEPEPHERQGTNPKRDDTLEDARANFYPYICQWCSKVLPAPPYQILYYYTPPQFPHYEALSTL